MHRQNPNKIKSFKIITNSTVYIVIAFPHIFVRMWCGVAY